MIVSIIVSFYNVENYAQRAIESVLAQDYEDIQFIFVDDNSTDNTLSILNYYAQMDDRVLVLAKKKNEGLAASRNSGIARATGEYIMFLDGDDFFLTKDIVSRIVSEVVKTEADWIDFPFALIYDDGRTKVRDVSTGLNNMYSGVWNKAYSRNLFEGVHFPVGRVFEDVVVSLQLFKKAKNRRTVNVYGVGYQQRDDSIVRNSQKPDRHLDVLIIINDYIKRVREIDELENKYFILQILKHYLVLLDETRFARAVRGDYRVQALPLVNELKSKTVSFEVKIMILILKTLFKLKNSWVELMLISSVNSLRKRVSR